MPRLVLTTAIALLALRTYAAPDVRTVRVPDSGIQPQAAIDDMGTLHLVYFKGDAAHGDLLYVRSTDDAKTFSRPIRVNSVDGSAIAAGTIRGAHLAIGRNNRPHIAWNGSGKPETADKLVPMFYTRLDDSGEAFEPQRNVITRRYGLDGGGSVAADRAGNVYVAWHAPEQQGTGEANRRVWVVRSSDDGKTFAPESAAFDAPTGACGCCGMRIFADPASGSLFALYRSATEQVHRDIYLLRSDDHAATFQGADISPMIVGTCIMSSAAFAASKDGPLAAWETQSQIYWSRIAPNGAKVARPIAAPGTGRNRKHPAIAASANGQVLLAWTENTAWNKGGSIAWQTFDEKGRPIAGAGGTAPDLPTWSLPAAFATREGGFVILY
jgi:hypothetical protein